MGNDRILSSDFMSDLKSLEGILHPVLERVKKDHTLMLAIRDGFINIYYRGGSILRITKEDSGFYRTFFDKRYNITDKITPIMPEIITNVYEAGIWVESLVNFKYFMDVFLSVNFKPEREYQQLVARENNFSSIANETEYFIPDIEIHESNSGGRIDMVAIRWPTTKRRSGRNCRLAFIEMKFGDGAISGKSGLIKHLNDIDSLIADKKKYSDLVMTVENQFNQLDQLGLLGFNKSKNFDKVSIDPILKPEVIIILANHNPRAKGLKKILSTPEIQKMSKSKLFDLRFSISSFAGYGLHTENMLPLDKFLMKNL